VAPKPSVGVKMDTNFFPVFSLLSSHATHFRHILRPGFDRFVSFVEG
jgi:hypothetical protein